MRIGLISDTHLPQAGPALYPEIKEVMAGADLIMHGGDLHVLSVLDWLGDIAPVAAAQGNGDSGLPEDPRVKWSQVCTVGGWRIGLVHALPLPKDAPWRTFEQTLDRYFGGRVDMIVSGDTHVEAISTYDGVLLVNPGSATLPHNLLPQPGTLGLVDIRDDRAGVQIISLATMKPCLELQFDRCAVHRL